MHANGFIVFETVCLCIVLLALMTTIYYIGKARAYNRITAKLRAGEHLSEMEQRLLDKVK